MLNGYIDRYSKQGYNYKKDGRDKNIVRKGQNYSQKGIKIQKIWEGLAFSENYSTCIILFIMAE